MFVSIIIPLIRLNAYVRESISHLSTLEYTDFEVLILPNEVSPQDRAEFADPRIRLIPTIKSSPAWKRNLGAREARGEILAFLDDDAYPKSDWLARAIPHFVDPRIGAVGGPAVTPHDDPLLAQVSGAVYTSFMGSGTYAYRYWPGEKEQFIDDFPSVNFLVRRSVFHAIQGFSADFWPGEDTKLCLDIVSKGHRILYDPAVFVWHHRRPSPYKHLYQVSNYARHRGYFMRRFPKTSLRLNYLIPTLFLLFLMITPFFFRFTVFVHLYVAVLFVYVTLLCIAGIIEALRYRILWLGVLVMPGIAATHLVYGIGIIRGFFTFRFHSTFRK